MKYFFVLFFLLIVFIPIGSAFHFIYGQTLDAKDGESANGHKVVVWNPINGINDNLTDIIGPTGKSYTSNTYMVDCELLSSPCVINDILSITVINSGDDYVSQTVNVSVTGAGFDQVQNFTLNSIPTAFTNFPLQGSLQNSSVDLRCSYFDWDYPIGNLTLYGNWSGSWQIENFSSINGSPLTRTFHESLSQGEYSYACRAEDNLSVGITTSNVTFKVDTSPPTINSLTLNESTFCGSTIVEATCSVDDNYGLSEVFIRTISNNGIIDYLASNFSGDFSTEILINVSGEWNFTCHAIDLVYNYNYFNIPNITVDSGKPDLSIGTIVFSDNSPYEGQEIIINASILNSGCSNANDLFVGAYLNNPFSGGILIPPTKKVNVSSFSNSYVDFLYTAIVGLSNIFIYADNTSIILEDNETNNLGNNSFRVTYWQEFYGKINQSKVLGFDLDFFNNWVKENGLQGNVFMADVESEIDWLSLRAIGKDSFGVDSSSDFSEIDSVLGMAGEIDSVYNTYTNSGTIKEFSNFQIHENSITNVPVVNSTNNTNFITGILWDSSDDFNGEYDSVEKEDLVFVAKLNESSWGKYGFYDYEIKIPVRLREYDNTNSQDVYFYYELN